MGKWIAIIGALLFATAASADHTYNGTMTGKSLAPPAIIFHEFTFDATTNATRAFDLGTSCQATFVDGAGGDVSIYEVATPSTAVAGSPRTTFTGTTTEAFGWVPGKRYGKAVANLSALGGVLTITCNGGLAGRGGSGGSHDACRSGSLQGGGYSSTDGRWAWTCGNFKWREWQDSVVANSASYDVTCTGDGTPHTSCVRANEVRHIGYGLNVSVAAQYTRDGGDVFLPEGAWVDNGAGLNAAGQNTGFPRPYDPSWESRSDFASLGYPSALRIILLPRGVRLIGEGVPVAATVDPNDPTVTIHRPKLFGTWLLDDRGLAYASSAAAARTKGGTNADIDPPNYYRMLVGGNPYTNYCETTSNTDPRCLTSSTANVARLAQDAPNGANAWGVDFSMLANYSTAAGSVCIPDADSSLGTGQGDAIGTCSLNRMIRCWDDDDADEPRNTGGCNFGAGGSFGACEAPYNALVTDYVTGGQDLQLAMGITECADNATSSADCASPLGWELYLQDFRNAPGAAFTGGSCAAGAGSTVTLGVAQSTANDFNGAIPFPNFYIGGTLAINRLFPVKRGSMDGKGGGFENIGRMPANWLTRDSATAGADCLSGGTIGESDDEANCDTDTLAAFAMSYNNLIGPGNLFFKASQYGGKSAVVETYPSGGPNDFVGNTIDTSYRHVAVDWGDGIFAYNKARNIGAWNTAYGFAACFGGECYFENNEITNSSLSYVWLADTAAQAVSIRDNKYRSNSVSEFYHYVRGAKNYSVIGDRIFSSYFSPYAFIGGGIMGVQKPTVTFSNVRGLMDLVGVASGTTAGGGIPVSFFLFEGNDTLDSFPDDWKSVLLDDVTLQTTTAEACLAWFEDDWDNITAGSGGTADVASNAREAANRVIIQNSNLISTSGSIACTGQYDFAAAIKDATDSDSWATEAFAPSLINNKVNNLPVPNMLPTVSEASVPNANVLPAGTIVRIHDGAAACGHTTGNLNSGSTVETCTNNRGANTWAEVP